MSSDAGAVRTATKQRRATLKLSTNILVPLSIHPSPSDWACSAMAEGMRRGSRSMTAQVITMSPLQTAGSKSRFWFSVPASATVRAATIVLCSGTGASTRPSSSMTRPR